MSNKTNLNKMCPSAAGAALGDRFEAVITLANELRDKWAGNYDPSPAAATWSADVKALTNELKAFAGDAVALTNELKDQLNKLHADVDALRTAYEAHRQDTDSHAAADTTNAAPALTASTVTEADLTAIQSSDIGDLNAQSIDLPAIDAPAVDPLDPA